MVSVQPYTDLRVAALERIAECYRIAREKWPHVNLPAPTVDFKTRGRAAGMAYYSRNHIELNAILLNENGTKFIERTPGHEAAHLISWRVFGREGCGHGAKWKHVMRVLGQDPKRCHDYDVTNSRVKKGGRVDYHCSTCQKSFSLASKSHNLVLSGRTYSHPCIAAPRGRGTLIQTNSPSAVTRLFPPQKPMRVEVPFMPAMAANNGETKITTARRVMQARHDQGLLSMTPRAGMIKLLRDAAGLTEAGAATYYAKLIKEFR